MQQCTEMSAPTHVELNEYPLHAYLENAIGVHVPCKLAVTPGKVQLGCDLMVYGIWSADAARIHQAKLNIKAMLRAWQYRYKGTPDEISLGIGLGSGRGMMLAADTDEMAGKLQRLIDWTLATGLAFRDNFDPWVVVNKAGGNHKQ